MQIFISGSLAYDRIMDFPGKFSDHILPEKIHILNVSFMVNSLVEKFGGTAGNIAYNLALLGEQPQVLATAGKDFESYANWFQKHNLPLDGIKCIEEEFTAGAYITTDKSDNQITGFNAGAMKHASNFSFDGTNPKETLAIVSPGNLEDMVGYSRIYQTQNIRYICDPGQQIPVLTKEELTHMVTGAEILIANDYELEMIIRATWLKKEELLERAKTIIVTLGENGSMVCSQDQEVKIKAVAVDQVTDPTGAGDAYRAGLIKGLVMGKNIVEAASLGSTCASFAVESYGTQDHHFTEENVWQRFYTNFLNPSDANK